MWLCSKLKFLSFPSYSITVDSKWMTFECSRVICTTSNFQWEVFIRSNCWFKTILPNKSEWFLSLQYCLRKNMLNSDHLEGNSDTSPSQPRNNVIIWILCIPLIRTPLMNYFKTHQSILILSTPHFKVNTLRLTTQSIHLESYQNLLRRVYSLSI